MGNNKNVILQNLKKVKIEKERLEKYIGKILNEEKNMKKVFPELVFVASEFKFWDNLQDKEQKIDAISFHLKEKFFIIFEYKRKKDINHIDQARTYLIALTHQHNGEARHKLERLVNKVIKRWGIKWEIELENFKSNLKAICLSLSFGSQINSITLEEKKKIVPIKLELYQDNFNEYFIIREIEKEGLKWLSNGNLFIVNKKMDKFPNNHFYSEKGIQARVVVKEQRWWIDALEEWVNDKVKPLLKKYPRLILKLNFGKERHRVFDKEKNKTSFDVLFKVPKNKNLWLINPTLYLVNPSQKLKNSYKDKLKFKSGDSYEYIIKKTDHFQEALILLDSFLAENN